MHLVDHGANVNYIEKDGWSPLFYAVSQGNVHLIIQLLEKGADLFHSTKEGQTVHSIAASQGKYELAMQLANVGISVSLHHGNADRILKLIEVGGNPDVSIESGSILGCENAKHPLIFFLLLNYIRLDSFDVFLRSG